jgi:sulfur-carrier protein
MVVKVLFFGVLSDVTGTDCKHYVEVKSVSDLKLRVMDDFPEVQHYSYRISLNSEILNSDRNLNDGDEIAFMPPFAGG